MNNDMSDDFGNGLDNKVQSSHHTRMNNSALTLKILHFGLCFFKFHPILELLDNRLKKEHVKN